MSLDFHREPEVPLASELVLHLQELFDSTKVAAVCDHHDA